MTAGPRLATALAREIDAPDAAGRQWVHLLPLGDVRTRDGRRYRVTNPRAVVAAFEAARITLPVDFEHQSERPGGGPAPAAGWITRLDVRPDGVWGHVEWNAATAAMIRRREYRYLSPALLFDPATREVLALRSAGLVHHPAMHLKAIASEDSPVPELTSPEELLAAIAEALELRSNADLDAIMAAIMDLRKGARPAKDAGPAVEAMAELLRDRNLRVAQLAEQRAAERVDAALAAGYITPAMHG
jgi:phage I-like protein